MTLQNPAGSITYGADRRRNHAPNNKLMTEALNDLFQKHGKPRIA